MWSREDRKVWAASDLRVLLSQLQAEFQPDDPSVREFALIFTGSSQFYGREGEQTLVILCNLESGAPPSFTVYNKRSVPYIGASYIPEEDEGGGIARELVHRWLRGDESVGAELTLSRRVEDSHVGIPIAPVNG